MSNELQSLEILTPTRMLAMPILESKGFIRLLDDSDISGKYVIFHGKLNACKITSSYNQARREFKRITSQG